MVVQVAHLPGRLAGARGGRGPLAAGQGAYVPQIVAVADTWLPSTDSMRRSPYRP